METLHLVPSGAKPGTCLTLRTSLWPLQGQASTAGWRAEGLTRGSSQATWQSLQWIINTCRRWCRGSLFSPWAGGTGAGEKKCLQPLGCRIREKGLSGWTHVRRLDIQNTRSPNSEFQIICIDVDRLPQRRWGIVIPILPSLCPSLPMESELDLVTHFPGRELGKRAETWTSLADTT